MSFAEFQIRLFAWSRIQEREWEKVRILAYNIACASPNRKKQMPSIEKFMPLTLDQKSSNAISDAQVQRFLQVSKDYYKQLNNK